MNSQTTQEEIQIAQATNDIEAAMNAFKNYRPASPPPPPSGMKTYSPATEDEDVCCVGCGERVCGFTEEPPHKDRKDEAVCDDCWDK